jgi:CHAD domain-containing protein
VTLEPDWPAGPATAAVLQSLLEVIEANLSGAIAGFDAEFLHDLRVSVRRSRAVQRELKRVFEPERLPRSRQDFRWLQRITGETRDLDVHVLEFDAVRQMVPAAQREQLDPVLAALGRRRSAARRKMVRALRSDRVGSLLAQWRELLEGLASGTAGAGADAALPIAEVSGRRIGRVYRRMVRRGEAIGADSPAAEYHELRKQGKELRYLLELFGAPLYPDAVVSPMIKTLKGLQDVLGRHQDREVQVAMLQSVAGEIAGDEPSSGAVMAIGVLIQRIEADKAAIRGRFAERLDAFTAKPVRRLVRETFG